MFSLFGASSDHLVRQSSYAECGLACIAMVAAHHGYESDLPKLRQRFGITSRGATLVELINIASDLGLGARPIRCELEDLADVELPAILHWDMVHYVVLSAVKGNKVTILDPARGKVTLALSDLDEHFTGVALELSPTADFEKKKEKSPVRLVDLVQFKNVGLKPIVQAMCLSIFLQIFVLIGPYFIQFVIDEAIVGFDVSLLITITLCFAALKLFEVFTIFFRGVLFQLIARALSFDLTASLFHHLSRLPLSYFQERSSGDIQQRFMSLDRISNFIVDGFVEAIIDGIFALAIGVILFIYSPVLALVVCGFTLLYGILRVLFVGLSMRLETDQQEVQAREANSFLETISSMQMIKVLGIENLREASWRAAATSAINSDLKVANIHTGYQALNNGIAGLCRILVVFLAAVAALKGDMTIGMITAFLAYMEQFQSSLIRLLDNLIGYKLLDVHLNRVADIAMTPREENLETQNAYANYEGNIELRGVNFRYGKQEPYVLEGVDISITAGEFVAIKGPSGGGKSTLLKLILGLVTTNEGEILYDDRPAKAWGLRNIRQKIGVVMQDEQLMAGSILENIAAFDADPDLEKAQWAAEVASIADDIDSMPMGYYTLIGEMGTALSGGQEQRVAIARALYRQPALLALDEGTSNLDLETEARINQNLKDLNITRVSIAHRPDTFLRADRILEVIDGKVYEGEISKIRRGSLRDLPHQRLRLVVGGARRSASRIRTAVSQLIGVEGET